MDSGNTKTAPGKPQVGYDGNTAPDKPKMNVYVEIEVYEISDEQQPRQLTQDKLNNYAILDICKKYRPVNTNFSAIFQEFKNQLEQAQAFENYSFTMIQVKNTLVARQYDEISQQTIEQFFQAENIVHDNEHLKEILIIANVE